MPQRILIVVPLLLPVAFVQATLRAGDIVMVEKFGYKLVVPKGWNIDLSESGVPMIFNFPRGEAPPQGLVPEHGAAIYCVPDLSALIPGVKEVERERIRRGADRGHTVLRTTRVPDSRPGIKFPRDVIRVDSDVKLDPSDEVIEREVSYSFRLGDTRFRLSMTYWRGDRKAARFESVLREILRSIVAI